MIKPGQGCSSLRIFYLVVCGMVVLLTSLAAQAFIRENNKPNKHIIAAAELSGLFHSSESKETNGDASNGVYHDILSQILQQTGLSASFEILVLPMRRAKFGFISEDFACYAPGLDTFDEEERKKLPDGVLSSAPLNKAIVRVLSFREDDLVSAPEDITRRDTIGVVRGVPISKMMQDMMERANKAFIVQSELENLKMLREGRINRMLTFYPDVLYAYERLGLEIEYPYDPDFSPLVIRDSLICHPEFQAAFDQIQQKILQYREDGTLREILGKLYME